MHTLSVKGNGGCFVVRKGVTHNKSIHLDSRYSDLSLKLALHSLIEDVKSVAEIEVTKAYHLIRTGGTIE